ncbi:MAG: translation initiation factor IF-2 N-terminal domain-containing protein, partial [Gemmatimonadales bacterium]|nr:translation initiation factor IF-2 N-terminal domain-containing protein [Gemmatimonadales bacterium]
MVKTRVHDLAAEFGVPPEQLLSLLRDMGITVRSHMSSLEADQVSALRVRWEREKRKAAEPAAAPKRKRAAKKAEEPAPAPAAEAPKPAKRRRTAAEVAQHEAQLEAERAVERAAALEFERASLLEAEREEPELSLEERARQLFRDLPPAPEPETVATEAPIAESGEEPPAAGLTLAADFVQPPRAPEAPVGEAGAAAPSAPPVGPRPGPRLQPPPPPM